MQRYDLLLLSFFKKRTVLVTEPITVSFDKMKKTLSLLLAATLTASDSIAQPDTKKHPFVLGAIEQIQSKELSETRTLNVYLPEGYNHDSPATYPVIYLLDGSADEDFIHIAGLVQFFNFPWINALPKSIVVGIANIDRRRDYTFPTTVEKDKKANPTSGHSDKFIAFLEKELKPYIGQRYKVSSTSTLLGQSLGGLLATEVLFKKPTMFNNYIIVSPSLWWNNESLLQTPLSFPQKTKTMVYIAVGKEGDVMENDAKKLAEILQKAPTGDMDIRFHFFEDEDHASILHLAAYDAFKFIGKK